MYALDSTRTQKKAALLAVCSHLPARAGLEDDGGLAEVVVLKPHPRVIVVDRRRRGVRRAGSGVSSVAASIKYNMGHFLVSPSF
jgi:hypothetical protein